MHDFHKVLLVAVALAVAGGALFFSFGQSFNFDSDKLFDQPFDLTKPETPAAIKLVFLGDIMLSRNIGAVALKNDFAYHARLIVRDLKNADLLMA